MMTQIHYFRLTKNKPYMIRAYTKRDETAVLIAFRSNIPKYFDALEEKELSQYLEDYPNDYYVLEKDGLVIGAGGIYYEKEYKDAANLAWGFIHADWHKKGYGRALVQYRMDILHNNEKIKRVGVKTSQHTYVFYEKNGFKLIDIKKDYWAPGIDFYLMEKEIA